jgi:hypothetical protein
MLPACSALKINPNAAKTMVPFHILRQFASTSTYPRVAFLTKNHLSKNKKKVPTCPQLSFEQVSDPIIYLRA